jgi:hypothetical protein
MVSEKKSGQIIHVMKVTILKEKNMAKVLMSGPMAANTMVTGMRIALKVMAPTYGLMGVSTQAPGRTILCTAMECILGKMVDAMKATMKWTRSMATVSISGLMVDDMKGIGIMESSMVRASTFCQMGL